MKSQKLAAIFTLLASVNAFAQWHTNAWENERLTTPHVTSLWACVQGPFSITNYLPPFPTNGASTNKTVSVQEFLSDISAEQWTTNGTGTNVYQRPIVRTYTWALTDSGGTNYTKSVTTTNTQTLQSMKLQARDVRALDCYFALTERGWTNHYGLFDVGDGTEFLKYAGPVLYRSDAQNLEMVKVGIAYLLGSFVDLDRISGEYADAHQATRPSPLGTFQMWTVSNLTASISAPTNYLAYTPARYVTTYTHIMTSTWLIVTAATGTVTNVTVNSCGQPVTLVGTNGQRFTATCTLTNIQDGYTGADYGWPNAREAIAKLTAKNVSGDLYGEHVSLSGNASIISACAWLAGYDYNCIDWGNKQELWDSAVAAIVSIGQPIEFGRAVYYGGSIGYAPGDLCEGEPATYDGVASGRAYRNYPIQGAVAVTDNPIANRTPSNVIIYAQTTRGTNVVTYGGCAWNGPGTYQPTPLANTWTNYTLIGSSKATPIGTTDAQHVGWLTTTVAPTLYLTGYDGIIRGVANSDCYGLCSLDAQAAGSAIGYIIGVADYAESFSYH